MVHRAAGRLLVAAAAALLTVASLVACNSEACRDDLLSHDCLTFLDPGPPSPHSGPPTLRVTAEVLDLHAYPGRRRAGSFEGEVEWVDEPSAHVQSLSSTKLTSELTDRRLVVWVDMDLDAQRDATEPAWVRIVEDDVGHERITISALDPASPGC